MLSDGLFAYLVARWSVLNTFEAAILRDFGEREDFERVLTHALRRGCGGRVLLSLMADGSLRLTGTKDPDISFGAVLLDLTAPVVPCNEESLALRVQVIDWRRCARCYDKTLAQRTPSPAVAAAIAQKLPAAKLRRAVLSFISGNPKLPARYPPLCRCCRRCGRQIFHSRPCACRTSPQGRPPKEVSPRAAAGRYHASTRK